MAAASAVVTSRPGEPRIPFHSMTQGDITSLSDPGNDKYSIRETLLTLNFKGDCRILILLRDIPHQQFNRPKIFLIKEEERKTTTSRRTTLYTLDSFSIFNACISTFRLFFQITFSLDKLARQTKAYPESFHLGACLGDGKA